MPYKRTQLRRLHGACSPWVIIFGPELAFSFCCSISFLL